MILYEVCGCDRDRFALALQQTFSFHTPSIPPAARASQIWNLCILGLAMRILYRQTVVV